MNDFDRSTDALLIQDCKLDAPQLGVQLARYRHLSRHATSVQRLVGEVLVHFADDLPAGLLERTLEVERDCCPFFLTAYDADERRLAITVESIDQDPRLDPLFDVLSPPDAGCCEPQVLSTCCEPGAKADCCGPTAASPPSSCGCQR